MNTPSPDRPLGDHIDQKEMPRIIKGAWVHEKVVDGVGYDSRPGSFC